MAKFYGVIGYIDTVEVEPGVWEEAVIERPYYGDLIRNTSKFQPSGGVNDDINISNNISIIADPYANENFQKMRYAEFMGAKWKITNVEIQYPRIILTVGGVYNGQQATTAN
jgi:hypothetical protein